VIITPITRTIGLLAESLGCTQERLVAVLLGPSDRSTDHPWHRMERGEIARDDLQALVQPMGAEAGLELRGDEYDRLLEPGQFEVNHAVLRRIESLQTAGVRTGLLTNGMREFRPTLEEICPPVLFDAYIDSSEVGCRKPDREIFELTIEALEVDPDEAVLLDDFEGNLRGARAVGLHTILVRDPNVALDELDELLG
jgi:epoxide hydrolase-like predicted phosphatase